MAVGKGGRGGEGGREGREGGREGGERERRMNTICRRMICVILTEQCMQTDI